MKKNFVEFYSPGTFVAEITRLPIDNWDINDAVRLSYTIKERHAATPYGFRFITMERADDELDSHESNRSNMYYLGGEILTLEQVKEHNDPNESVLLSNMISNHYDRIVVNTNSWKWTAPLEDNDVVLSYSKEKK